MNCNFDFYTLIFNLNMQDISLKDLLEAGCHFGHKSDRWHPKAAGFIFQERDGIHVIDLAKTKSGLALAAEFIKQLAKSGGTVLFVGTKRQAAAIIKEEAETVGAAYIKKRWIGGFLTNWEQVHKNLDKIRRLTEEEKNGTWNKYPKHERVKLSRYLHKLNEFYGGVVPLTEPPKALVVIDIKREAVAVAEANNVATPVIAVVDTNSDPTPVQYVIPANDDAVGSIKFITHYLAEAYREGNEERAKETEKSQSEAKVEKVEEVGKVEKVSAKGRLAVGQEKVEQAEKVSAKDQATTVQEKAEQVEKQVDVAVKPEAKPQDAPKKSGRKKKTVE